MTSAAVSDAGPIIHLGEIESLELLSIFDSLLVPKTVYDEIERGGVPEGVPDLSFDIVEADGDGAASEELDAGERAALTVAAERSVLLLTDDLAARESAAERDIEVHGSIGVIALDTLVDFSTETKPQRVCGHSNVRPPSSLPRQS